MGSCRASDVLERCKSWLGYEEGPNNYNYFGKELSRVGFFNGDKTYVEWCASYVLYCLTASCFTDDQTADERPLADQKWDGLYFTYEPTRDNCACGARYCAGYFRDAGAWYSIKEAKPGDFIFFGPRGDETHVGIIYKIEDGRVFTYEGNSGNAVRAKDYSINYSKISGVGRPRYDAEPDPEPTPEPTPTPPEPTPPEPGPEPTPTPTPTPPEPTPTPDPEHMVVRVNTRLNVRSGPSTDYPIIRQLTNNTEVYVYERDGNWGRIGDGEWVCTDYLAPYTAASKYRVTAKSGLNIRSGPGTDYKKIGALNYGQVVNVTNIEDGWAKLAAPGYVCADYLERY